VQGHECLYNLQHKDYDYNLVKDNCWKEIAIITSSSQRSIPSTVKSGSSTPQKKKDDPLNSRARSSDISVYHADFHEGHSTDGEQQGSGRVVVGQRHGNGMVYVN
jgi:hypothetical protein